MEYVAVLVRQPAVKWFINRNSGFEELAASDDGIFRSEVFPGRWLDPTALLRLDSQAVRATLEQGLVTPEHQQFAQRLAAAQDESASADPKWELMSIAPLHRHDGEGWPQAGMRPSRQT